MTTPLPPQKSQHGFKRVWNAFFYSLEGLRQGWYEPAFRQEAVLSVVMLPAAFWVGQTWVEIALLIGTVLMVMMVELLNTGIETAMDRFGPEWNAFTKRAKDMGSAAVMLSLVFCGGVWGTALYRWSAL
jgi:diacylglycerol kinase (ATP)